MDGAISLCRTYLSGRLPLGSAMTLYVFVRRIGDGIYRNRMSTKNSP